MPKHKRNIYYDHFAEQFEFTYGLPYQNKTADFVQLARLFNGLGARLTVEVWKRGCENYFKSEIGVHTVADLCCRFVPFWRGPLDRYGKPLRYNGTRTGIRTVVDMNGLPWQIRFAQKVNKAYDAHPVPEMAEALSDLFDQMENEQLGEEEATRRLEAIENA